jgi:hypothetical protein
MYVRIARFEGGDRNWDEFAAGVRDTIRSGGQGTPFEKASDAGRRARRPNLGGEVRGGARRETRHLAPHECRRLDSRLCV